MRMSKELYRELDNAVRPFLHLNSANTMRHRWDMLWASKFDVRKFYDAGLNDDHIDTALRKIVGGVS